MRVRSIVERRLLISYRLDPDAARRIVPAPLDLSLVNDWAVGGICLIRLGRVRPAGAPKFLGLRSENAAHRISVSLDGRPGVYIPRRDTASIATVAAGGVMFPGEHHRARFDVTETDDELRVAFESADGSVRVQARATVGARLASALFQSADEASTFYREASVAYSETKGGCVLDGVEIEPEAWQAEPIAKLEVASSYFDDVERFPAGSAVLDSALVMRNLTADWVPRKSLRVA